MNVTKVVLSACVESLNTVVYTQTRMLDTRNGWWQLGKLAGERSQEVVAKSEDLSLHLTCNRGKAQNICDSRNQLSEGSGFQTPPTIHSKKSKSLRPTTLINVCMHHCLQTVSPDSTNSYYACCTLVFYNLFHFSWKSTASQLNWFRWVKTYSLK